MVTLRITFALQDLSSSLPGESKLTPFDDSRYKQLKIPRTKETNKLPILMNDDSLVLSIYFFELYFVFSGKMIIVLFFL